MRKNLLLMLVLVWAVSCSKEPGSGGTATLTGRIKVQEYNESFTELKNEYYAQAENVYLVYGDEQTHSDSYKTTPEGYFNFEFLRKGKYKVYVYSEDSSTAAGSGAAPIYIEANITKNGETLNLGEITVLKSSKWNSGTSTISGRVFVKDYNTDFTLLIGQYYGYDEDVFIVKGNDVYYSGDCSTDVNGWYSFDRIPAGHYTVYGVSRDSTGTWPGGYCPVKKEVDITGNFQQIVLDDIIILI